MNRAETEYHERRRRFADQVREVERRSRRISHARLGVFLVGAAAFMAPVFGARPSVAYGSAAAGCAAVFGLLVVLHGRLERRQRRADEGRRVNDEALSRLARAWDDVAEPRLDAGTVSAKAMPSFARDLDLFGHASLWKLLGTVSTPLGKATLARWLLEGAAPDEVRSRQQAVRELAPRLGFRQELQLRARAMEKLDPDCEPFLRWAEDEPWLARRPALRWGARILPAIVLTLLGLSLAGLVPHHFWILAALANLTLGAAAGKEIHAIFSRISAREGEFLDYSRALELLAQADWLGKGAPRLARLRERLTAAKLDAPHQMARLHRLVTVSDVRYSGTLHGPLQAFFLWDVHALAGLERWQAEAGRAARGWLDALGEVEALCALAGLAFDEPGWSFPELVVPAAPDEHLLEARELGHPLLAPGVRVANDVTVGPPGTFLLITGSNMSGKSTLIRALGLNAVLAQAGGPVCARRLRLPPLDLGTSVLIEDSLEDGVSFFMAELKRVKEIVDLAADSRRRGRALLYLMDEILRGTNTVERQAAVRKVVLHLLRQGAIGALSTHDLMLAELEDLAPACRAVHFRETVESAPGRPPMTFDYKLRPGVATTHNALRLLELVGLGLDQPPENVDPR